VHLALAGTQFLLVRLPRRIAWNSRVGRHRTRLLRRASALALVVTGPIRAPIAIAVASAAAPAAALFFAFARAGQRGFGGAGALRRLAGLRLLRSRVRRPLLLRWALVRPALAALPAVALRLPARALIWPALAAMLRATLAAAALVPGAVAAVITTLAASAMSLLWPALPLRLVSARIARRSHRGIVGRLGRGVLLARLVPALDAAE
jgi:hypothetical protein